TTAYREPREAEARGPSVTEGDAGEHVEQERRPEGLEGARRAGCECHGDGRAACEQEDPRGGAHRVLVDHGHRVTGEPRPDHGVRALFGRGHQLAAVLASCSATLRRTSSMSSSRTLLTRSSSAGAGRAPGWANTRIPSRKAMRVGIEVIAARAASSRSASVSTLPKVMSGCLAAAASNTGANMRHGAHHAAQKSTRTIPGADTVLSKFSSVRVLVLMTTLLNCIPRGVSTTIPQGVYPLNHPDRHAEIGGNEPATGPNPPTCAPCRAGSWPSRPRGAPGQGRLHGVTTGPGRTQRRRGIVAAATILLVLGAVVAIALQRRDTAPEDAASPAPSTQSPASSPTPTPSPTTAPSSSASPDPTQTQDPPAREPSVSDFYLDPLTRAAAAAERATGTERELIDKIASTPQAFWVASTDPAVAAAAVRDYTERAHTDG